MLNHICEVHCLSSAVTAQEVWVQPGSDIRLKMMRMSMMTVRQDGGTHL